MKQKTNILVLTLVALFFVSTTGVTVYKHHCSHGGQFYGIFVDVVHDCEPEEPTAIEKHLCCTNSENEDLTVEEDCCTSDVEMYQIDTDLALNDLNLDFISLFTFTSVNSTPVLFAEFKTLPFSNKAPPFLTTSKRLSLFQLYLI